MFELHKSPVAMVIFTHIYIFKVDKTKNLEKEFHHVQRRARQFCVEKQQAAAPLRVQDHKRLIENQNSHQLFNRYRVNQLQRGRHGGGYPACKRVQKHVI